MDATTPKRRRRYSDAEQADALLALAASGGAIDDVAHQLGIPPRTLQAWASGLRRPPRDHQLCAQKRAALRDGIAALARRVLRRALKVADDEGTPVSLRDAAVTIGICVDKIDRLDGRDGGGGPGLTVNINPVSVSITAADIEAAKRLLGATRPTPITTDDTDSTT